MGIAYTYSQIQTERAPVSEFKDIKRRSLFVQISQNLVSFSLERFLGISAQCFEREVKSAGDR
jgi:hypothetical protein